MICSYLKNIDMTHYCTKFQGPTVTLPAQGYKAILTGTLRNGVNCSARTVESNQTIHKMSKLLFLGGGVSLFGTIECMGHLISNLKEYTFEEIRMERDLQKVKASTALLAYHISNVLTLGFLGYSIRNEKNHASGFAGSVLSGCPYGDQDYTPVKKTELECMGAWVGRSEVPRVTRHSANSPENMLNSRETNAEEFLGLQELFSED